ncbi:sensor histidine kinase [Catalinimonas alkaloidigena]|nr:PAS domain S-box protein [Catalinimonas alkaloidigena]
MDFKSAPLDTFCQMFRAVFDTTHLGILIYESVEKLLYVNPAGCALLEQAHETLTSRPPRDVLSASAFTTVVAFLEAAQAGQEYVSSWRNSTLTHTRDLLLRGRRIAVGDQTLYYASLQDVTREKRTQQQWQDLQRLFDISPVMFCIAGPDGYFKKINRSFVQTLGYSEQELCSKPFVRFVHPDDVYPTLAEYQKLLDGGHTSVEFVNRYLTKRGDYLYLSWHAVPFGEQFYCSCRDVTAEKHAEAERARITQALEMRNRELEQFSYIISHNLRSPVNNITSLGYLIQEAGPNDPQMPVFLEGITKSTARLASVIQDLSLILQLKQSASDKKEPVQFSELFNAVQLSIQSSIAEAKADIQTDFREVDEMVTLRAYLYSIFYNLISNAIKYRRPEVPLQLLIKSQRMGERVVRLTFKDNGKGIDLKKAGEQFFGLYQRFHNHVDGKGMGLFMVKNQVEALGGRIYVESEVDQGTEFTIDFLS